MGRAGFFGLFPKWSEMVPPGPGIIIWGPGPFIWGAWALYMGVPGRCYMPIHPVWTVPDIWYVPGLGPEQGQTFLLTVQLQKYELLTLTGLAAAFTGLSISRLNETMPCLNWTDTGKCPSAPPMRGYRLRDLWYDHACTM